MSTIVGPPVPPPQPPAAPPAPPCPPTMMNFNTPVPPPMMTQYAQTSSQSTNSNQSQTHPIYGTSQTNNYAINANSQTSQYPVNTNPGQYTASQNSIYGSNGQVAYGQNAQTCQSNSQYPINSNNAQQYSGSQYGSSSSINQYAQVQGQYGVVQSQSSQYVQGQSVGNANPYGTPTNAANQFGSVAAGAPVNANPYNPISSSGPPPPPMGPPGGPVAPPPPPPPPAPNATSNVIPNAPSMGGMLNSSAEPPDTNSLASALQAMKLKKKQVRFC